jgi:uncharacterized peroxidase-related enzyme
MAISPERTKALRELADVLLRGPNTLTPAERETIATYVSSQNDCRFCQLSHGAAAAEHLGGDYDLIDHVKRNFATVKISDKLKSLLAIAGKVQKGGKYVTPEDIGRARQQGATDKEIHDTVLIAAAFCMFNRYVRLPRDGANHGPRRLRQAGPGKDSRGHRSAKIDSPNRRTACGSHSIFNFRKVYPAFANRAKRVRLVLTENVACRPRGRTNLYNLSFQRGS